MMTLVRARSVVWLLLVPAATHLRNYISCQYCLVNFEPLQRVITHHGHPDCKHLIDADQGSCTSSVEDDDLAEIPDASLQERLYSDWGTRCVAEEGPGDTHGLGLESTWASEDYTELQEAYPCTAR